MQSDLTNLSAFKEKLSKLTVGAEMLPTPVIVLSIDMRVVYMNQIGLAMIGTTLEKLSKLSGNQYLQSYFNGEHSNDYAQKILSVITSNTEAEVSFFQQVKSFKTGKWMLFASNVKVFSRDSEGNATHLLTVASKLDAEHHVASNVDRLLEDVRFLRENSLLFSKLSKREREVLKFMALGINSSEIAEKLFISTPTVNTHRRNIRNKLALKNNYDAVRFAQAYNLL